MKASPQQSQRVRCGDCPSFSVRKQTDEAATRETVRVRPRALRPATGAEPRARGGQSDPCTGTSATGTNPRAWQGSQPCPLSGRLYHRPLGSSRGHAGATRSASEDRHRPPEASARRPERVTSLRVSTSARVLLRAGPEQVAGAEAAPDVPAGSAGWKSPFGDFGTKCVVVLFYPLTLLIWVVQGRAGGVR